MFLFEFTGVEQEFKTIQSFKREGKIGFLSGDKDSQKAEVQLSKLLKTLQITTPGNNYDSYQFGTYGIGGFIDNHLDTYGTPDSPMENILDLKSGLYCFFWTFVKVAQSQRVFHFGSILEKRCLF